MLIHTTNTHCIRSTIRLTLNVGAWSMTYEATITRQRLQIWCVYLKNMNTTYA